MGVVRNRRVFVERANVVTMKYIGVRGGFGVYRRHSSMALQHASDALKADPEIMLAVVRQLKAEKELALTEVQQDGTAQLFIDEDKVGADLKQRVQAAIDERRQTLEEAALNEQLSAETLDVTLPGRGEQPGALHPVGLKLTGCQD